MATYRLVAVVLAPAPGAVAPPPGIDGERYRAALLADTLDVADDLAGVTPLLAVRAGDEAARAAAWPGLAVTEVPAEPAAALRHALDAAAATGATIGVVLSGDAPDFPRLLVGKLFSACEDRLAGASPASASPPHGGLAGFATRLPVPEWLRASDVSLDTPDALATLDAIAPRREVVVVAGWHRLRGPADIAALDPGLEGWPRTRALLEGR